MAPRAGAAQVRLGWAPALQRVLEPSGGPEAGKGRPFRAGSRLRAEGEAEVVERRGADRSAQEPARCTLAARLSRALVLLAVSVSQGDRRLAPGRPGAVVLGPRRSALPVPRPPRDGPCPGLAGTIALRLQ